MIERFTGAGVPAENVSFERDTYTFNFPGSPAEFVEVFRTYYGANENGTSIPATFLRVTVVV